MSTRYQQLGGFVASTAAVPDARLRAFYAAGGRYVVVLLAQLGYPDDHDPAVAANLADIGRFRSACVSAGLACGGWFNGWAGGDLHTTADQDADHVAAIVRRYNLGPVFLDCELAYKENPQELPKLTAAVRSRLATRALFVSTNEPNDSMIWNGGSLGRGASMWALGVRLAPQWYGSSPVYAGSMWMHPDQTMQWLKQHGMEDNFHDPLAPQQRAVPLSWTKGTLEVTGLEAANLAAGIAEVHAAKQFGYDYGLSVYTIDSMPDTDLALLAAERGRLFLT